MELFNQSMFMLPPKSKTMSICGALLTVLSFSGVFSQNLQARDLVFGHVTQEELVIPCEFNMEGWSEGITVHWYRHPDERAILVRGIGEEEGAERGFSGRETLGPGCSLVLSQPNVNDTGRYWVEIRNHGIGGHAQKAYVTVAVTDRVLRENSWTEGCVASVESTLQNWLRSASAGHGQIQAAVFTLCCLVLVYGFLGLMGAAILELKVTERRKLDAGEVTRSYCPYIPLMIGIIVFALTLTLTTTGMVGDDVALWLFIATGVSNTVGAAIFLTHEICHQNSRGFLEQIIALQKEDDNFLDDTLCDFPRADGG